MLKFFKKKRVMKEENKLELSFNLSEIPQKDIVLEKIAEYFKKGIPIWSWYNTIEHPADKNGNWSYDMLLTLQKGKLNNFVMYRKEKEFLCKYSLEISNNGSELYFFLEQIRELKNSNIMDIINCELLQAYKVYLDEKNVASEMLFVDHDITEEKAKEYLKSHRVMYIDKAHFVKNSEHIEREEDK